MQITARRLITYWRAVENLYEPHTNLTIYPNVMEAESRLRSLQAKYGNDPASVVCWFAYWLIMEHPFGDCNHRTSQLAIYRLLEQAGIPVDDIPWDAGADLLSSIDQKQDHRLNRQRLEDYLAWLRERIRIALSNRGFDFNARRSSSTSSAVGSGMRRRKGRTSTDTDWPFDL